QARVGEAEVGLRIAGAIWRFWSMRGYLSEGRKQIEGLLALSSLPALHSVPTSSSPSYESAVSDVSGYQATLSTPPESQSRWGQSGQLYRAKALNGAGRLAIVQWDMAAARAQWEESLAISRELGDERSIAASLHGLGTVAYNQSDIAVARALWEESLA